MKISLNSVSNKPIYGLIIAFLLIGFNPQRGNAFNPFHANIVYISGSGDYYNNIYGAVQDANEGDVIIIYPGTYTDTDLEIPNKITIKGIGEVYWSASDTLFVLGADDVTFEGISFKVTGSVDLAVMDTFRYVMKNCTLRCQTLDFGQDTSHWIGCHLYPQTADGWEITGSSAIAQMRDCKMGDDIPGPRVLICGLNVSGEATLSAYYCNFYSDSTAILCDDGRLRLYYCMVIGTDGPAVKAEKSSNVSCLYTSFEGNDDFYNSATIEILDESEAQLNRCIVRNMKDNSSIYIETEGDIALIDNNFKGLIHLDEPPAAASGDIAFYGFNSTTEGGILDESGDKKFGNVVNLHAYGEGAFSGHATISVVTVNGMPSNGTVNVTYKNDSAVNSHDAVMAVYVDLDGGRFFVHRDNDNNTDGLEFFWTAEWEEENE